VANRVPAEASDLLPLVYTVMVFAFALLVPALINRIFFSQRPSDPDDGDENGGGGRWPWVPPKPPPGGLPLGESRPARVRLRDARRLAQRIPRRERRRAREPARAPVRHA